MTRIRILRQALFASVTVGTLCFGTVQALAAPRAQAARLCTPEQEGYCMDYCWKRGADGGTCQTGGGGCKCYYN